MRRIFLLTVGQNTCTSGTVVSSLARGDGPLSSAASTSLWTSARFVQFQQTSETNRGFNEDKPRLSARWVTKSTLEYMSEAEARASPDASEPESTAAKGTREAILARDKNRVVFLKEVNENTSRVFQSEVERMKDFRVRRGRKSWDMFKRHGTAFIITYILAYFGCLAALYVAISRKWINTHYAIGTLQGMLGQPTGEEDFYKKIEAWDTYLDFGFAFVINEAIEIMRFPIVMFGFYTFRPFVQVLGRKTKKSIFRRNAAEQ